MNIVMDTKLLADVIARDILAKRPSSPEALTCFACGRPYSRGDGRFCSGKCRPAFDAGFTPGEIIAKPRDGVPIVCQGCNRTFVSKGLKCCSMVCERAFHERDAIAATMAEVGMELSARRKCLECGADILRWTGVGKKRRLVKKTAKFCSPKCSRKAKTHLPARTASTDNNEAQKPLQHKASSTPAAVGAP